MLKIAVLDDEIEYIQMIREVTAQTMLELDLKYELKEYVDVEQFLFDLREKDYYDVYLLDMELPRKNGLEIARMIRREFWEPVIIYITNHVDYAVQAFEVNAYRFIPKEDLKRRLPKAYQMLSKKDWFEHQKVYTIENNVRIEQIPYREIYYLKKDGKYVIIVHQRGESSVRRTLQEIMKELNSDLFIVVDRGIVVNLRHVMSLKGQDITMRNDTVLPVSKPRMQLVRQAILKKWR